MHAMIDRSLPTEICYGLPTAHLALARSAHGLPRARTVDSDLADRAVRTITGLKANLTCIHRTRLRRGGRQAACGTMRLDTCMFTQL